MSEISPATQALATVQRDVDATFTGTITLKLRWVNDELFIALSDGRFHGEPVSDLVATSPASLLGRIAEAAQDTIMGVLWQVWPTCPLHNTGAHISVHSTEDIDRSVHQKKEQPYWWCGTGSPHLIAPVGHLARGE